ncbi:hypothetical protein HanIR_Chr06g0268511 [Helianthus annuus]|nr:hypothetical protein HanIR_Chr06g0268511 [Helianthus annuus]
MQTNFSSFLLFSTRIWQICFVRILHILLHFYHLKGAGFTSVTWAVFVAASETFSFQKPVLFFCLGYPRGNFWLG